MQNLWKKSIETVWWRYSYSTVNRWVKPWSWRFSGGCIVLSIWPLRFLCLFVWDISSILWCCSKWIYILSHYLDVLASVIWSLRLIHVVDSIEWEYMYIVRIIAWSQIFFEKYMRIVFCIVSTFKRLYLMAAYLYFGLVSIIFQSNCICNLGY